MNQASVMCPTFISIVQKLINQKKTALNSVISSVDSWDKRMDLMRSFTKILLLKRKKKEQQKNAKSVCICVINTISVIYKESREQI